MGITLKLWGKVILNQVWESNKGILGSNISQNLISYGPFRRKGGKYEETQFAKNRKPSPGERQMEFTGGLKDQVPHKTAVQHTWNNRARLEQKDRWRHGDWDTLYRAAEGMRMLAGDRKKATHMETTTAKRNKHK